MNNNQKLFSSAALSSGAKVLQRVIGLVSTLILARILTPDDFAVVAIISIALHFFDTLSHSGSEQYIIQKSTVSDNDLNSAWTLDICLKGAMCLLLIFLSTFLASFFDDDRLTLVMQVVSLVLLINALKNPALISLKRQLQYKGIFQLTLLQRVVTFIVVIGVAFQYESYWAFIVADLAGALTYTLGSYFISAYRPKLRVTEISTQWLFSRWLMGKSILGYLRSQIDTLIVAKFFPSTLLGNYYMARDIAMLPANSLLAPAMEPLLADFKDYKTQSKELGARFSKVFVVAMAMVVPITVFMSAYSVQIILVLLGEQWHKAGSMLEIMSFMFAYYVFLLLVEHALVALERVKLIFVFDLVGLFLLIASLLIAVWWSDNIQVVLWLRVAVGILMTFLIGAFLHQLIKIELFMLLKAWLLLSVVSGFSLAVAKLILMANLHVVLELVSSGVLFCGLYVALTAVILPKFTQVDIFKMLKSIRS